MRLSDPSFTPVWQKAVKEFNNEQFFECHETLEAFWLICSDPIEKEFLQGIIQTAAAMIKLKEKNYKGLKNLINRALPKLMQALASTTNCKSYLKLNQLVTELTEMNHYLARQNHTLLNVIKLIT